jgi:hypothetical protein
MDGVVVLKTIGGGFDWFGSSKPESGFVTGLLDR